MAHYFLHLLRSPNNPVLLLLSVALVAATLLKYRGRPGVCSFFIRCGIALAVTFVLAHFNRWEHLWKGHEPFPSGHMTFFLCVATSIVLLYRWSLIVLLPAALAYGWLLVVFLHHHSWLDIDGAWLMAPAVTLLCHYWRRGAAASPSALLRTTPES